jgi:hypothetical protein
MRRILPTRLSVLAEVRWASQGSRPAEGIGVVSGRHVQVALRIKHEGACVVAALEALLGGGQEHLLRGHVHDIPLHGETAQPLAVEIRGRIQAVDPLVLGKLWIQGETEETVLLSVEDLQFAADDRVAEAGFPNLECAADLVEENAPVRSKVELHGLRHAGSEDFDFKAVVRHLAMQNAWSEKGGGGEEECSGEDGLFHLGRKGVAVRGKTIARR